MSLFRDLPTATGTGSATYRTADASPLTGLGHVRTAAELPSLMLEKMVIAYGTEVSEVVIPYDVERERRRRENLLANYGPAVNETFAVPER